MLKYEADLCKEVESFIGRGVPYPMCPEDLYRAQLLISRLLLAIVHKMHDQQWGYL